MQRAKNFVDPGRWFSTMLTARARAGCLAGGETPRADDQSVLPSIRSCMPPHRRRSPRLIDWMIEAGNVKSSVYDKPRELVCYRYFDASALRVAISGQM